VIDFQTKILVNIVLPESYIDNWVLGDLALK
jgi:hypothetical protein